VLRTEAKDSERMKERKRETTTGLRKRKKEGGGGKRRRVKHGCKLQRLFIPPLKAPCHHMVIVLCDCHFRTRPAQEPREDHVVIGEARVFRWLCCRSDLMPNLIPTAEQRTDSQKDTRARRPHITNPEPEKREARLRLVLIRSHRNHDITTQFHTGCEWTGGRRDTDTTQLWCKEVTEKQEDQGW